MSCETNAVITDDDRRTVRVHTYLEARHAERLAEILAELPPDLRADAMVLADAEADAAIEVSREFERRLFAEPIFYRGRVNT